MIAEVVVNSNVTELNKTFDYAIPEGMVVLPRNESFNSFW